MGRWLSYDSRTLMDERLEKLVEKAKGLPKAPGVYLMKDDKGRVIYIGKSASLRDRVCSYFQRGYNARLLDDKTFPYLMITTGEEFPGVYITREPRKNGVKLYGPFTSVYALKEAITHLQKAFKFRTCHLDIRDE